MAVPIANIMEPADWQDREMERLEAENAKLRHDLEDANNQAEEVCIENAKLREQIHWLKQGDILHVLTDQEYIDQCEREHLMQVSIDALDNENAKLRELVRELWRTMDLLNACDVNEYDEPLNCIYCEQWGTVGKNIIGCKLKYRMCELGVDA